MGVSFSIEQRKLTMYNMCSSLDTRRICMLAVVTDDLSNSRHIVRFVNMYTVNTGHVVFSLDDY